MIDPAIEALTNVEQAGPERGDRDDQLGGVPERRVEEAADALAGPLGDLFGGPAEPARERHDREPRRDEDQQRSFGRDMLEHHRDRNEREEPIEAHAPPVCSVGPGRGMK